MTVFLVNLMLSFKTFRDCYDDSCHYGSYGRYLCYHGLHSMSKIYDEVQGADRQKCPSKYKKDDEGMHIVVKCRLTTTEELHIVE